MGKVFGYFVLAIFFVAIIFSIITASGKDDLLDKLEAEPTQEAEVTEMTQPEAVLPQPMHLDPNMPISYTINTPQLQRLVLLENANESDIKGLLSRDITVVAKVDTRKLNNPYYEVDEVIFLTITGYTSTHFETFDTNRLENKYFAYLITDFMRALAETGGDVMYVL